MASDETGHLGSLLETGGRLVEALFRLEILVWVGIFGVVLGYFVYGQLLPTVSQSTAIVGGGVIGVLCAAGLAYLAVAMDL